MRIKPPPERRFPHFTAGTIPRGFLVSRDYRVLEFANPLLLPKIKDTVLEVGAWKRNEASLAYMEGE